jgi:hypothetical protein
VLGFGISTLVLTFLVMGHNVPVTPISLPAALGVIRGGGALGGAVCGIIGGLLGEIAARVALIHGDTHIEPPAAPTSAPEHMATAAYCPVFTPISPAGH